MWISRWARYGLPCMLLCSGTLVSAANVVFNPSLEIPGPGGVEPALFWSMPQPTNGSNQRTSDRSSDGAWSLFMSTRGDTANGGTVLAAQISVNNGQASLAENQQISLRFDIDDRPVGISIQERGEVRFSILDASMRIVDETILKFLGTTPGQFVTLETDHLTVPAFTPQNNAYYWQFGFRVDTPTGIGGVNAYNEVYIDNVIIDARLVPEPGSLALGLTMGGSWLLAALRRRCPLC